MSKEEDIVINLKESSLAEFTKRPVPNPKEVAAFEQAIGRKNQMDEEDGFEEFDEEKEEEIEESLSEIYQDDAGRLVDVKHLQKSRSHGFIFWFTSFFFLLSVLLVGAYFAYVTYYLPSGNNAASVELAVEAKTEVIAGEEFFYEIRYKNPMNIAIKNVLIEAKYPQNYIFLDSYPTPQEDSQSQWRIERLGPQASEVIKVRGKIVGREGQTGIFFATMNFEPENFSSEFKKETSITTTVSDIGLNVDFDYSSNALVNEKDKVLVYVSAQEKSFINSLRLSVDIPENVSLAVPEAGKEGILEHEEIRPGVWVLSGINSEKLNLPVDVVFKEKLDNKQQLEFVFEYTDSNGNWYEFKREAIEFEVMKSDLNLTLIINGSRSDQGVNFGDTLNYSIVYNNKGETDMKDVVIMAVMQSDFLDWTSLQNPQAGTEKGNTITWTKQEIPALAQISPNQEGTIDFSLRLSGLGDSVVDKQFQVKSFAQFSIGSIGEEEGDVPPAEEEEDNNRSNVIVNRINSDLGILEKVRYFSEDNIPVGTGPHPPKVGEETTYKVYWELTNNLHELRNLVVKTVLPSGVFWNGKERSTAGEVKYLAEENAVVWDIGRLPITVFKTNAEFGIKIRPTEEDKNTIKVLVNGTQVSAVDSETQAELKVVNKAKTTRLEDDDIAQGDGIVN